jgi:uncharacterized protein YjiS (DUF1127 family)
MILHLILRAALYAWRFAAPPTDAAKRIHNWVSRIGALMMRCGERLRSSRRLGELRRLNDHLLRDIGLTRDSLSATERSWPSGSVAPLGWKQNEGDGGAELPTPKSPGTHSLSTRSLRVRTGPILVLVRGGGDTAGGHAAATFSAGATGDVPLTGAADPSRKSNKLANGDP